MAGLREVKIYRDCSMKAWGRSTCRPAQPDTRRRRLARWFGVADVRSRLAEFAAGLDRGWIEEVAQYALDYLSGSGARGGR